MSAETSQWLNTNILRGFTEKRGKAWHYSAADQGDESNHYDGAIPVEDVRRRLFSWTAEPRTLHIPDSNGDLIPLNGNVAWVRSDNNDVLGIHSAKYNGHQYDEWLIEHVESLIDDKLAVASAGLLKNGAIAWVQIETPDNIVGAEGVTIRPFLMATTSFDGSIATTYKQGYTDVVCDNTRAMFLSETGPTFRVKHTLNSNFKALEARDGLQMIFAETEAFLAEIAALTNVEVSDSDWSKFVEAHVPIGEDTKARGVTMAENKRAELTGVYRGDSRVTPWAGSAWGVIQAVNTHMHHYGNVRQSTNRVERNMLRAVKGEVAGNDFAALTTLESVLGVKIEAKAPKPSLILV
jgi:phage/plasmid-like protein (TIGR03299 family)